MADPIRYTHNLTGRRRLIKTHLPLPFLPPGILTTCKVLLSHSHVIVPTEMLKGDPSDQELEGLRSVLLPPQPQHLPS